MKAYIPFLIALLFNIVSQADVKIEYRINRLHGLFNFVLAAADEPHSSPGLKEVFLRSKFNTKENQELLNDFSHLEKNLSNGFDLKKAAPGRWSNVQVKNQILTQTFYAKDLSDLNQRTIGLMPMADQIQLFSILKRFEPIYDTLVWKNSFSQLKKHKSELEILAKRIDLQMMFKTAEIFYNANWPKDIPFTIGLYPIPFLKNFNNSTNSQSLASIEEHGVLIGVKDDQNESFGVIFHELCHSLYQSQSDEFKKEFYDYFANSKFPERFQAYDWINEVLATAIGNGWAYERAAQSIDKKSWYNEPTLDSFAKEIFENTKDYLNQQKKIDQKFIDSAILSYQKLFPNAAYSYEKILKRILFSHNKSVTDNATAKKIFRKKFNSSDFEGSAPLAHKNNVSSILESEDTVVILFTEKDFSDLEELAMNYPLLKENLKAVSKMKNRSIYTVFDKVYHALVLIKVDSPEQFELAIDKMLEVKQVDPKNPVQTF